MYDAIAIQVLGTRGTKFFGSRGLLGVSFLRAGQQRKHDSDGGHHGHGWQNQRVARRKCPVLTSKGERCCQLAHCLASGEKQTCRKELIFQMATRNESSRGLESTAFFNLSSCCSEDRPASLFLFQRPIL
jgi:hypothetical protein